MLHILLISSIFRRLTGDACNCRNHLAHRPDAAEPQGNKGSSGTNNLLVALKILALLIFILVGAAALFTSGNFSNYHPFFPIGFSGVMSGATIIFFAFIGFNTIAVMAEEIRDLEENVPRAILFAFAVCTLIYLGVSSVVCRGS